jgi:hypothetical protein
MVGTNASASDGTFRVEDFEEMLRSLPPRRNPPVDMFSFASMPVIESPFATEDREEHFTFKGHPIVQWLAKYLHFDPDVHMVKVHRRPTVFRFGNTLVMHPNCRAMIVDTSIG